MNDLSNLIQSMFFTSFKRTAMVIGGIVVALSLPVTIILVQQQQDLRQRAAGDSCTPFAPGIDKLPDGWTWDQNGTPCASCEIEPYCYQDATGQYQHGVSPTDTGGVQCGKEICTPDQYCKTIPPPGPRQTASKRCVDRLTPTPTLAFGSGLDGHVFIDTNGNGIRNEGESGYSGAMVQLRGAENDNFTTDSSGWYRGDTFGYSDGDYTVRLVVPEGYSMTSANPVAWTAPPNAEIDFGIKIAPTLTPIPTATVTLTPTLHPSAVPTNTPAPTRPPTPTVTLTLTPTVHPSSVPTNTPVPTGTPIPTPTLPPDSTTLAMSVRMPGIGLSSGGIENNPTPSRPFREAEVVVLDGDGNVVHSTIVNRTLDSDAASIFNDDLLFIYSGIEDLGTNFSSGSYTVKIRFDNTLFKRIPIIVEIVSDTENQAPAVTLVPGDLNQNNTMDIQDYNDFIACFRGDPSCDSNLLTLADLNDNGNIDILDLNILQRGFAIREGD